MFSPISQMAGSFLKRHNSLEIFSMKHLMWMIILCYQKNDLEDFNGVVVQQQQEVTTTIRNQITTLNPTTEKFPL
jgi:hypothetical protein